MFKKWLLSEDKYKVGRPKLADNDILKKSWYMIIGLWILCAFLFFSFICSIKKINVLDELYHVSLEKVFGEKENKDGFIVNSYYDDNNDYVMKVSVTDKLNSYSGSYEYSVYYLDNNTWKKKETTRIKEDNKNFLIKIKSKKNKNETYKVRLRVVNAGNIEKSYAPTNWMFVDSDKKEETYAYRVITVKGYYSPVVNKNKKGMVSITTDKDDARKFNLSVPKDSFDIKIYYTDEVGKEVLYSKANGLSDNIKFAIPKVDKLSKVKIKLWIKDIVNEDDLNKLKPTNWNVKNDVNGNNYLVGTYDLKPEIK